MSASRSVRRGVFLLAFTAAAAHAQAPDPAVQQGAEQPASPPVAQPQEAAQAQDSGEMALKKLLGQRATDVQGQDLGKVRDIVIDLRAGKVHAAVVSFGGFLGMGNTQYAFPMSDLKPGQDKRVMIDVDKRKLEKAEGFAKGQWLGMDPEYWGRHGGERQASAGQGEASAGGTASPAPMLTLVRAGAILDEEVRDRSGDKAGKLRDLVVTPGDGRLKHALIDVDKARQATIPTGAIIIGVDNKLVLNMTAEELRGRAQKPQAK